MDFPGYAGAHLTYCLNVHPGETWAEQRAAIDTHARAVKARAAPDRPFGLGLRISRRAVDELADPTAVAALRAWLDGEGFYAFTVNGFPFGAFHGRPVKRDVYRPDWRDPARTDYTLRLAAILAGLLPEGLDGSISTVPVAYRADLAGPADAAAAVEQLAACAAGLHDLEQRTGCEIHLGLEPEPDCLLESTPDTVDFFRETLLPVGTAWLRRARGCGLAQAEAILQRHVGVCFDTCHLSLAFEDLAESLGVFAGFGIRLSKVQLSAALRAPMTAAAARRLAAFADPVYLHQARYVQDDGVIAGVPDLTPAFLADWAAGDPSRECRVHVHVPLYVDAFDGLASTADDLTPGVLRAAHAAGARHFEIETYTFDVLPPALRQPGVAASIGDEFAWLLAPAFSRRGGAACGRVAAQSPAGPRGPAARG